MPSSATSCQAGLLLRRVGEALERVDVVRRDQLARLALERRVVGEADAAAAAAPSRRVKSAETSRHRLGRQRHRACTGTRQRGRSASSASKMCGDDACANTGRSTLRRIEARSRRTSKSVRAARSRRAPCRASRRPAACAGASAARRARTGAGRCRIVMASGHRASSSPSLVDVDVLPPVVPEHRAAGSRSRAGCVMSIETRFERVLVRHVGERERSSLVETAALRSGPSGSACALDRRARRTPAA